MRLILTIALSTLMLAGCVANWPSHRTGPRFTSGPGFTYPDQGLTPPLSNSGPSSPQGSH